MLDKLSSVLLIKRINILFLENSSISMTPTSELTSPVTGQGAVLEC